MIDYIKEQEKTCHSILKNYQENLQSFEQVIEEKRPKNWLILATGSSLNATLSAKYYIEKTAGVSVEVLEPFTFLNYEKVKKSTDFILAISQSGHSSSTIDALEKANNFGGIPTAVLTSDLNSPITNHTNTVIDIGCGEEKVGYVTKGFTSTVLTLMLMGIVAGSTLKKLTLEGKLKEIEEFESAIKQIPCIIKRSERFYKQHEQQFKQIARFAVVGYGPTVGTAKECETKFTETVRVPTQGFELEAYMHGPYLEVNASYGLVIIQTKSPHTERAERLKNYFSAYTDHCFSVASWEEDKEDTISIGIEIDEYKSPLLMVLPFQVLAYRITLGKGIDIDKEIFSDFDKVLKSKI